MDVLLEMIFDFFFMLQNVTLEAKGGFALYTIFCVLFVTALGFFFIGRDLVKLFKKMVNTKKAKQ